MSTLHITLVGEQPEPIYYVIEELKPNAVVYICSRQTKGKAEAIRHLLGGDKQTIMILDPTDAQEISRQADQLAEALQDKEEITVNISGGSKPWSYLFGQRFSLMPNATVLFLDQNNILWNYRTMTGSPIHYRFDLMKSLELRGNLLKEYHDFSLYTEKDVEAQRDVEWARRCNVKAFTGLMSIMDKDCQEEMRTNTEGKFILKNSHAGSDNYVEWFKATKDNPNAFVRLNLISTKTDTPNTFEIESPHAIELAFNSGWFEFKIARMLSKWDKVRKIYMNCIFPINDKIDKNEVDIIIETDIKAIFVECKTNISKINDIDKFRSIVKNYGGTSCSGLFITEGKLRDDVQQKCTDNSITYFSLSPYGGKINQANKDLIQLLESQYKTINTR